MIESSLPKFPTALPKINESPARPVNDWKSEHPEFAKIVNRLWYSLKIKLKYGEYFSLSFVRYFKLPVNNIDKTLVLENLKLYDNSRIIRHVASTLVYIPYKLPYALEQNITSLTM